MDAAVGVLGVHDAECAAALAQIEREYSVAVVLGSGYAVEVANREHGLPRTVVAACRLVVGEETEGRQCAAVGCGEGGVLVFYGEELTGVAQGSVGCHKLLCVGRIEVSLFSVDGQASWCLIEHHLAHGDRCVVGGAFDAVEACITLVGHHLSEVDGPAVAYYGVVFLGPSACGGDFYTTRCSFVAGVVFATIHLVEVHAWVVGCHDHDEFVVVGEVGIVEVCERCIAINGDGWLVDMVLACHIAAGGGVHCIVPPTEHRGQEVAVSFAREVGVGVFDVSTSLGLDAGEGEVVEHTPCEYCVGRLVHLDGDALAGIYVCIEFHPILALVHEGLGLTCVVGVGR